LAVGRDFQHHSGAADVGPGICLHSALRIRPTSVIDAVLAIAPVVTGIVCGVLWMVDYLHLSLFQLNALAMLTITGIVEFISTLWVRNVVLQRGFSVMPQGTT